MPINIGRRKLIALIGSATVATAVATPLTAQERDSRAGPPLLSRVLQLQANAAAGTIGDFINEVRGQIGWTVQLPWTLGKMEERRFDGLRLLRQAPAVAEIAMLDPGGKEQLRLSRIAMDEVGRRTDFSQDPRFTEAVAHGVYYGPIGLLRPSPIRPSPPERCESDQGNGREISGIEGLGVLVMATNGQIEVVAPIDNTPAAKAGIMAGDIIVALDEQSLQGLTLHQAVERMRGPHQAHHHTQRARYAHRVFIDPCGHPPGRSRASMSAGQPTGSFSTDTLRDALARRCAPRERRERGRGRPQAGSGRDPTAQGRPARRRLCSRRSGPRHRALRHVQANLCDRWQSH